MRFIKGVPEVRRNLFLIKRVRRYQYCIFSLRGVKQLSPLLKYFDLPPDGKDQIGQTLKLRYLEIYRDLVYRQWSQTFLKGSKKSQDLQGSHGLIYRQWLQTFLKGMQDNVYGMIFQKANTRFHCMKWKISYIALQLLTF